jgi:hypothetical protein
MTARQQRTAVVLGVTLFLSYAYFYPAGGWNQNSRFALIRAVLERGTLKIDAYQLHTGDRAFWRGHYYTDKAPGASLLALAPVQAARLVSRAAGVDPASFPGIAWTSYVAAVVTSGIFTVIAALCVFWLSLRWGATSGAALFAATAYGPARPGPTPRCSRTRTDAGCLMIALVAADLLGEAGPKCVRLKLPILGLAGGWAVVTESPGGDTAIFIGSLAIARARDAEERVVGPVIRMRPVSPSRRCRCSSTTRWRSDRRSTGLLERRRIQASCRPFFGITYPSLWRVRELLFGAYRASCRCRR